METMRYLLSFLVKFGLGLLLLGLIWWLVGILYPDMQVKNLFPNKTLGESWLPSPRKYGRLLTATKPPDVHTNELGTVPAFNANGEVFDSQTSYGSTNANFVTYTVVGPQPKPLAPNQVYYTIPSGEAKGIQTIQTKSVEPYATKSLYIRNLSLYDGYHLVNGTTFVGDARHTMFVNGKFPIIVADLLGRPVTVAFAEATSDWTVPGWVHFRAKISAYLPNTSKCVMVFEQAIVKRTGHDNPVRVAIPVWCN